MPQPQKISATDARNNFADIVNQAAYSKQEFLITRHDEVMARIVPAEVHKEDKTTVEDKVKSPSADKEEDKEFVQQEHRPEEKEVTQQQEEQVEDSQQSDQKQAEQQSNESNQVSQDASTDLSPQETGQQSVTEQATEQDGGQGPAAIQRPKKIDLTVRATRIETAEVLEPQSQADRENESVQPDDSSKTSQNEAAVPTGLQPGQKEASEQEKMSEQNQSQMSDEERRLAEIKKRILKIYRG